MPTASKVQCVLTFNGQPVQFADIFKIEEQYFSLKNIQKTLFCIKKQLKNIIFQWLKKQLKKHIFSKKNTKRTVLFIKTVRGT